MQFIYNIMYMYFKKYYKNHGFSVFTWYCNFHVFLFNRLHSNLKIVYFVVIIANVNFTIFYSKKIERNTIV